MLPLIQYTGCIMSKNSFVCKNKCSLSGQKDNAGNVPISKKIIMTNIMSDVLPWYFFSVVKGVLKITHLQLIHIRLGDKCQPYGLLDSYADLTYH